MATLTPQVKFVGSSGSPLDELNDTIQKVQSSLYATKTDLTNQITQATNAALAMIPKDGLKVPLKSALESTIYSTNTAPEDGDNYYVENLDVNSPGNSGQVWYATASNGWNWKVDSHIPQDGVSILLNIDGSESVSQNWVESRIEQSPYIQKTMARFPTTPTSYTLTNFTDGTLWTAPNDGWLLISGEDHGVFQAWVYLEAWFRPTINNIQTNLCIAQQNYPGGYGASPRLTIPVRKGISLELKTNLTNSWFEFVY